ncbi:MAG: hypothetical protein BAA01_00830 [Bacillus thermozeamaize]|uniref:CamS family sex pheromone protein n=1 Tax=Bacillus thermozeamaize TaxID=230954 RepID=A0A1Y3PAP2_9BACI|nr:MAG: hypothetical protein BAA01_00830 [Bacillus thermozeamaize]
MNSLRRRLIPFAVFFWCLSLLTGCQVNLLPNEAEEPEATPRIISPAANVNEIAYRGVLPYTPVAFAGLSKLNDLQKSQLERTMMTRATAHFPPDKYLFQEGQLISREEGSSWLKEWERMLGHPFVLGFLEHDYLTEQGELGGMVLGVAVTSGYTPVVKGAPQSPVRFSENQIRQMSQTVADDLVGRLRQKANAPIVVLIVLHDPDEAFVPGGMLMESVAKEGSQKVTQWNEVAEEWMLLPHPRGGSGDHQTAINTSFKQLQEQIEDYFPRFASVSGMARFQKQQLVELTVEINAEYDSQEQITQLAQFVIAKLPDVIPNQTQVNLYIRSLNQPQAIYVRQADGTEFFHLYRQ